MRDVMLVFVCALLVGCGDKIYNTTQTVEGGSIIYKGKCFNRLNRDTVKTLESIDLKRYVLSATIAIYNIQSWYRYYVDADTDSIEFGADTIPVGFYGVRRYQIINDTMSIQIDKYLTTQCNYFEIVAHRREP